MTALELFLIAYVIVMVALAAYFFLQTRKAIAERERYHTEFIERKRGKLVFRGATGSSGAALPQGAGANSVDYSNPMVSLLRDDFDYTPERCDSSSFSDSSYSYSCDSGSSSDSGSTGGGE